MRKFLAMVLTLLVMGSGVAHAHQPVILLDTDTTAAKGPLLVDGTVSFAVRAGFVKAGAKKAFRAQFNQGDALSVQYLIVDKKPERTLPTRKLPTVLITDPSGSKIKIKLNERVKFYEPYGKVNYLYLARYQAEAKSGVYSFVITSKSKAEVTIAVGEREVTGEVLRGNVPAPEPTVSVTPTPTPMPMPIASATPTATPAGYTMENVRANKTTVSCWSAINGNVYDLTNWINSHPGGPGAIIGLCGTDGSAEFAAKHQGQKNPEARLSGYLLGPLAK